MPNGARNRIPPVPSLLKQMVTIRELAAPSDYPSPPALNPWPSSLKGPSAVLKVVEMDHAGHFGFR